MALVSRRSLSTPRASDYEGEEKPMMVNDEWSGGREEESALEGQVCRMTVLGHHVLSHRQVNVRVGLQISVLHPRGRHRGSEGRQRQKGRATR